MTDNTTAATSGERTAVAVADDPDDVRPEGQAWQGTADHADGARVTVALRPDPRPLDRVASGLPRPPRPRPSLDDEEGSLVTEYGLIAILGATAVSLVLKFLSGGALFELFGAVMGQVRALVGA